MRFRQTLTFLILGTGLVFALSAWAQQRPVAPGGTGPGIAGSPAKPFTEEQVSNMVRDGFGDESGAKLNTRECYIRVRSFLSTLMGD